MPVIVPAPKRADIYKFNVLTDAKPFPDRSLIEGLIVEGWGRSCELPQEISALICPPAPAPKPDAGTNPDDATFQPFVFGEAFQCATAGNTQETTSAEARRLLEQGTNWYVSGTLSQQLAALALDQVFTTAVSAGCALAEAEEVLALQLGLSGYIYANPGTVSRWLETHAVFVQGERLYTRLGSRVFVLPTQPPPAAPVGVTESYVYVLSDAVDVYLSDIQILEEYRDTTRSLNSFYALAERAAALVLTPCYSAAIRVGWCI